MARCYRIRTQIRETDVRRPARRGSIPDVFAAFETRQDGNGDTRRKRPRAGSLQVDFPHQEMTASVGAVSANDVESNFHSGIRAV
jgi:hypothetical protein